MSLIEIKKKLLMAQGDLPIEFVTSTIERTATPGGGASLSGVQIGDVIISIIAVNSSNTPSVSGVGTTTPSLAGTAVSSGSFRFFVYVAIATATTVSITTTGGGTSGRTTAVLAYRNSLGSIPDYALATNPSSETHRFAAMSATKKSFAIYASATGNLFRTPVSGVGGLIERAAYTDGNAPNLRVWDAFTDPGSIATRDIVYNQTISVQGQAGASFILEGL